MTSLFKYLSLGMLLFFTQSLFAQQHYEGINWGFKLGLANNGFHTDVGPWTYKETFRGTGNTETFKSVDNSSLQFGAFIGYDFNDYLSLQADLQYTSKGDSYERASNEAYTVYSYGGSTNEREYITYQLRYIEIPLAIRVTPIKRFSLKLGIAPGFNIYSKIKYNSWVADDDSKTMDEYPFNQMDLDAAKEETDKVDFDYASPVILSGLAEIHYNIKRGFIYISYNQSLTDIFSINKINGFNYQTTDSYVGVGFAYRFITY